MNENDENVDPMRDAAPDVEHLRLEISENGEVFYRIDDVTLMMLRRCQQLLFSFFFLVSRERKRRRRNFYVFSKWFSSRQLGFWCSFPNKRKTISVYCLLAIFRPRESSLVG